MTLVPALTKTVDQVNQRPGAALDVVQLDPVDNLVAASKSFGNWKLVVGRCSRYSRTQYQQGSKNKLVEKTCDHSSEFLCLGRVSGRKSPQLDQCVRAQWLAGCVREPGRKPCFFADQAMQKPTASNTVSAQGKIWTPQRSSSTPPSTPPPAITLFHATTFIDSATSAPSPAASASAVCSNVAAPPNVRPHTATPA